MADSACSEQPELVRLSCESKLKEQGRSTESIASSVSDSFNKTAVFAASRFSSLKWTTVHKFITEHCDVQLHQPAKSNIAELYDSLEDMIKDAFSGDLLRWHKSVLKTDFPDLSTDERLCTLANFLSAFDFPNTVDSASTSHDREQLRRMHSVTSNTVSRKISELNLTATDRTPTEWGILRGLEEFVDSYSILIERKITSEDSYRECFKKYLEALSLRTFSPPGEGWQYLRPAIAWSDSGKTFAEPDGTVFTKKSVMKICVKPLAYIEVKRPRETKYKKAGDSERCLLGREAKPKVPWHYVQEVLDGVLPQHFLQLLLSADDTVFQTEKKEGGMLQSYFTKVGLIQQGMMVNVVILKICEEDFQWLVPGEEKGQELHKEYEASKRSRDCPEATENSPNQEGPASKRSKDCPERTESLPNEEGPASKRSRKCPEATESFPNEEGPASKRRKCPEASESFPNKEGPRPETEAFSSGPDEDNENGLIFVEEEIVKEKGFIRSLRSTRSHKKVRFQDLVDDDSGLEETPPVLYISKTYSLLNNEERIHLAYGLLMLETIADNIVSDIH